MNQGRPLRGRGSYQDGSERKSSRNRHNVKGALPQGPGRLPGGGGLGWREDSLEAAAGGAPCAHLGLQKPHVAQFQEVCGVVGGGSLAGNPLCSHQPWWSAP